MEYPFGTPVFEPRVFNGNIHYVASNPVTSNSADFNCAGVGLNEVTLIVTDSSGNSATCISNVTVVDSIPPIAICQDLNDSIRREWYSKYNGE